jgi:hypothetical protein
LTGEPLQIHPIKARSEFESEEDFWKYFDAITRWNSHPPPPRALPKAEDVQGSIPVARLSRAASSKPASRFKPTKSRHLGLRLTETDYSMLCELARAHGVRPGTTARMLVVRAVRASADESEKRAA